MCVSPILIYMLDLLINKVGWFTPLRTKSGYYVGLASGWVFLLILLLNWKHLETAGQATGAPWTVYEYSISQPRSICQYISLSIFPVDLCFDYYWPAETVIWRIALMHGSILILALFALYLLFHRHILAFPSLLFLAWLAPSSSIIPIPDLCVEYRAYLPHVAIIFYICLFFVWLTEKISWVIPKYLCLWLFPVVVFTTMASLTILRNVDYSSPINLWRDTTIKSPGNPRAWNNLADHQISQGLFIEAVASADNSIKSSETYNMGWLSAGRARTYAGHPAEAIPYFYKFITLSTNTDYRSTAFAVKGIALRQLNRLVDSMESLELALQESPQNLFAMRHLIETCLMIPRPERAEVVAKSALKLSPNSALLHLYLGKSQRLQGLLTPAKMNLARSIEINPTADAYYELALVLAGTNQTESAIKLINQAIQLDPNRLEYQEERSRLMEP